MKFLEGQACKKPYRKTPLVFGIILLSLAALFILLTIIAIVKDETDALTGFVIFGVFCLIPGVILFSIGLTKKLKSAKEYKEMQGVDYETWRNERLNDPSNPLFSVNCNRCGGLIEYDLKGIDGTRAWFPNGYVVCPKCNAIMRHNAQNAKQQP